MEKIELSKRLLKATEYTVENKTIADIGSDHAYLPIYLLQRNKVPSAIAGEVAEGPYQNAKQKVREHDLTDKVDVRYGSGLHVLQPDEEIGTIFICGMGGALITDILSEGLQTGHLPSTARLVLQPNNAEKRVRKFLQNNNYAIIHEEIVEDHHRIYEIIIAEYQQEEVTYSFEELMFGPVLIKEQSVVFKQKWQNELKKHQDILSQLEQSENIEKKKEFLQKIHAIQKVIK